MPFAWVAETAGILASASLLIALIVLLFIYDDKIVFEWKGVTLNTVVSVLSTASKAALLYTTSELMSQWKWIVFTGARRPLIDFQRIDAASRGLLRSSEIIWRSRAFGWLRLGALVVVLSIAADPLNQQLIQYQQRVVYSIDTSTTMHRARRYTRGTETVAAIFEISISCISNCPDETATEIRMLTRQGSELMNFSSVVANAEADFSMQSSILYGLDQPVENVLQQGSFNCPTGNCTWPPFESLAVCNRCTDVTARLESIVVDTGQYAVLDPDENSPDVELFEFRDSGTAFRLPNGLYLENANGWENNGTAVVDYYSQSPLTAGIMMTTLGTTNATETISAHDVDTLIWSMSMIRVRPNATAVAWPDLPPVAMECALFYCVNSYEFEVSKSILAVTNEQRTDAKREADSWAADLTGRTGEPLNESLLESIAFQNLRSLAGRTDLMLVSPASGARFNISQPAVDGISYYFQSAFASELNVRNISDSKKGRRNGFYDNIHQLEYKPSIMQALYASQDLNATFTALATSMSNAIRTGSDEIFEGVPNIVTGSKGELTTFYRVVWPWISLHCFIVTTGAVFLLITIRENKKHGWAVPMWKSSSLAVLNRGPEVAGLLSGMQTLEQMEAISKTSEVMLLDKVAESSSLEHLDFDPLEVEN